VKKITVNDTMGKSRGEKTRDGIRANLVGTVAAPLREKSGPRDGGCDYKGDRLEWKTRGELSDPNLKK